jgi:Ser/Thr protein kinase RdoA (MazF antagonist)
MSKAILPVEYSVVSSTSLQQELSLIYEFPSGSKVTFLHQGIHDTYLVSNGSIHLILRIYRAGWKSVENVKAELEVLLDLKQRGIDVAVPYKDRDGLYVQELLFPEGPRYAVVFMYAPGIKLRQLNAESAELFGKKLAALHMASIDMEYPGLQRNYYLANVFHNTMENISTVFTELKMIESLKALYFKMDTVFNAVDIDQLKVGICHGDPHFENAHFKLESGKVAFYDFDFCGNGYLLYDVGSFCHHERSNEQNIMAFLNGYNQVLPLNSTESKMIPFFTALMKIFHLGTRAKNADGNRNPVWPSSEIRSKLAEIEKDVNQLAS